MPDSVRFNATKMLSGHWDPYPIDMAFHPPCVTESLIGLARPGVPAQGSSALACKTHLHQNHICTPARRGHTRLLYRMCMDFMQYLKYVPYIDRVWQNVANQVLGEDLVLVVGQQDRMQKGDDTWANPMPYDKIAVRLLSLADWFTGWLNDVGTCRHDCMHGKARACFVTCTGMCTPVLLCGGAPSRAVVLASKLLAGHAHTSAAPVLETAPMPRAILLT